MRDREFDEEELHGLYARQFAGERLSRSESALVARYEKALKEQMRFEVLQSVPKRDYIAMSGRQQKVLDQQGERYGLDELLKPRIDLTRLIHQFHDLLAKHWVKFSAEASEADLMKGGGNSPALERYRRAKAEREELELASRRRELVPVDELREKLGAMAAMVRTRGEAMERAGGAVVRREFDLMIDDWLDAVRRWFPDDSDAPEDKAKGREDDRHAS